jgi:hypothetical protein
VALNRSEDKSGGLKVSQTSYDYIRPYWDQIGAAIVGRHVFDMTDGWDGKPPGGVDHVVVVTHRPEPEGCFYLPAASTARSTSGPAGRCGVPDGEGRGGSGGRADRGLVT